MLRQNTGEVLQNIGRGKKNSEYITENNLKIDKYDYMN